MKTYPITHYEYILRDPKRYLGYDLKGFIDLMGSKEFDFIEFKNMIEKNDHDITWRMVFAAGIEQGNMAVQMMFHILRLKTYGEKIYYISREVCELLLDTRLTIDASFLESPFKEIYLYTDQDHFTITDYTGTMKMKGIYVSLEVESDGVKKMRFLATSGAEGIDEMKDVNYYACFIIPEEGDLEVACNSQIKRFEGRKLSITKYEISDDTLESIFRFCVNALIYIGCRNANLSHIMPLSLQQAAAGKKSRGKIAKIERKMRKSAQCPFIYVTHNWGDKEDREAHKEGKKLDHQVLVSGHWRGQWYKDDGGNKCKKVIRIASYLKGAGKEESNKKYIVK